jgi:hypothetical protein
MHYYDNADERVGQLGSKQENGLKSKKVSGASKIR